MATTAQDAPTLLSRLTQQCRLLQAWVWSPNHLVQPEPLRRLHQLLRVLWIIAIEAQRDRVTLRASALTFTVVLSLVPFLALGTAVLKGLGAGDQMRQAAYQFIDRMEAGQVADSATPGTTERETGPKTASLTTHLRTAVDTIFDYVERTNFATLGAFGIVGLLLAVLSVLGNIEQSMNAVWQSSANRPIGRKLIDYLALMVLLPVAINLTLATEATLKSPTLFSRIQAWLPVTWLQHLLLNLLPVAVVVITFTVMYRFLPNTRVRVLPALVGGLAGGLGWLLLQAVYLSLQIGVARYNAIYGSFATLPLFLVWIYTGWVVFLLGAETAFAVQVWPTYLPPHRLRWSPAAQLSLAVEIMHGVVSAFQRRQLARRRELADGLGVGQAQVAEILRVLETAGLIRRVDEEDGSGYLPAGPAAEINGGELVRVVWGSEEDAANPWAAEALRAARNAMARRRFDTAPAGPLPAALFAADGAATGPDIPKAATAPPGAAPADQP